MTDCAQRRNTRRRFRGTVFMALQAAPDGAPDGLDRAFRRIAVCADYARACCALAQWPAGEIWRVPPGDGAPLRRYLEGGPSPFETVPALAFPRNLVTDRGRCRGRDPDGEAGRFGSAHRGAGCRRPAVEGKNNAALGVNR